MNEVITLSMYLCMKLFTFILFVMISIRIFLNIYCAFACTLLALLWYFSTSNYNFWKNYNVKYVKPVPFFGNISRVLLQKKAFHEIIQEIYASNRVERFVGMYYFRDPVLLVKDPELVNAVLVTDAKHFYDRDVCLFVNEDSSRHLNPISANLFTIKGARWRAIRQKILPEFTSGKLKLMLNKIFECVALLDGVLETQMEGEDSKDVALRNHYERLTIDVIGSCAFGIECNMLKPNVSSGEKFRRMAKETFEPRISNALRLIVSVFSGRLCTLLRLSDLKKEVNDFYLSLTLDTIEYRRQNGVKRDDLLQSLMDMQNSHVNPKYAVGNRENALPNYEFTEYDVAGNTFLFLFAGYETITSTLTYCLYELALNENIQQRLHTEVQQIKDEYNELTYESLKKMTYMDSVIDETLRKYPPLTVIPRECTKKYRIPETNIVLPVGTKVVIPAWSIHRDWKYFPNPEVFDPKRFAGGYKGIHPGVYFPFGNGPRYCLGKRFAYMEIKAAISDLLLKYELKPCSKTAIPMKFEPGSVLLHSTCGIWINITKRKFEQC